MSSESTRRKFKVNRYVARCVSAVGPALSSSWRSPCTRSDRLVPDPPFPSASLVSLLFLRLGRARPPRPSSPAGSLGSRIEEIARCSRQARSIAVAYLHPRHPAPPSSATKMASFHAASTMKVPVMMALFAAVESGQMRLDQPIAGEGTSSRASWTARSFSLDPQEDGDPDLYQAARQHAPVGRADPAHDHPQLQSRHQPPHREGRRLDRRPT